MMMSQRNIIAFLGVLLASFVMQPTHVWAQACTLPNQGNMSTRNTGTAVDQTSLNEWNASYDAITQNVEDEFEKLVEFTETDLWEDNILVALKMMSDQITATAMQQVMVVGTFFDAKHQMETQRTLRKFHAEAHKDYHPSVGVCEIGTNVRSLAASERKGEYTGLVMARRSIDRRLNRINTAAKDGSALDKTNRMIQFTERFCNPADMNGSLRREGGAAANNFLCASEEGGPTHLQNADIDFGRMVAFPWTIQADFSNNGGDQDEADTEEALLALGSNLYGHEILNPDFGIPAEAKRQDDLTLGNLSAEQRNSFYTAFMKRRAIEAQRSVAETSFHAIVGMKSKGSGGSAEFMNGVMEELGVTPEDKIADLIGEEPSYDAQMKVLTQKLAQSPDFYTNLYDKPANVARKEVALQAIGLMQKFDLLKSHLRSEASMAVMLENRVNRVLGRVSVRDQ